MGNCNSTESDELPPSRPAQIGQPQDLTLHIPRRRIDDDGFEIQVVDHELTRREIQQALKYTADYLHQKRQNLSVVTVGGAVNTLLLRSRQTTHDVDFFGAHLSHRQLEIIDEAMQYAERMSSAPLGGAWLNNETQLHMNPHARQLISQEALEQNTVVFESPGLKVVAAPWHYSFISKSLRLETEYERSYDLADAVTYLREWSLLVDGDNVSVTMIRDICERFRMNMICEKALQRINEKFYADYHLRGIMT